MQWLNNGETDELLRLDEYKYNTYLNKYIAILSIIV